MDRGNVLSGAAFSAVFMSAVAFLIVIITTGFLAYFYVQKTMLGELEEQIGAEKIMLENIYRTQGSDALISTLGDLEEAVIHGHVMGLFDANGSKIAGNIGVAPDYVGWSRNPLTITHSWTPDKAAREIGMFYVHTNGIDDLTLVVGRSVAAVQKTERAMIKTLAISAFVVVLTMLGTGYLFSRKSLQKLEQMDSTLALVSDGDISARMAVSPDNDQIDRIAIRLNTHLDTLSRLMISTRATAAAVAHDLKSPLARAYLGLGRALARTEAGKDPQAEIEDTQAELEGMTKIFDTYLRLARIETRADGVRFALVDLHALLDDLVDSYQLVAEDNGQSLIYECPEGERFNIVGDAAMIQQMVVNLLQNAVSHCKAGTEIRLGLHRKAGHILLIVADTGPGIPETARNAVFEPFHRLDPSRSKPGSGLGLALVCAIAERHGARIILSDNEPGLKVIVEFPLKS